MTKHINSNLGYVQYLPEHYTAETLESKTFNDARFHWLYGILENRGYIGLYAGWLALQFKINPGSVMKRYKYGANPWSEWSEF